MEFRKLPITVEVEEQVDEQREVETPEGTHVADPGDVILRGVHGERYPVKPEIFAKTYVPEDPDDLDAFAFYEEVLPEGVQVYTQEQNGDVQVTGVGVPNPDELEDPEEFDRAVEFARELSRVLGLKEPPLEFDEDDEDEEGSAA